MKEVSDNQSRQINVGREDQELGVEHVIAPYSCKYLEHDNGEDSVAFNEVGCSDHNFFGEEKCRAQVGSRNTGY
ncbi:hypothetical protein HPP92_025645 [Vanilla planifolia]|uniref:Uncharacterized protein n=1 Tax=Vanilla planifolia TaxID=51239 RepID=A0A835PI92_VANPL|nr:hypothetical protein HPP92_025645 [Vanilla planifolia]